MEVVRLDYHREDIVREKILILITDSAREVSQTVFNNLCPTHHTRVVHMLASIATSLIRNKNQQQQQKQQQQQNCLS